MVSLGNSCETGLHAIRTCLHAVQHCPSLSPALTFMALPLRSPGYSAKSMMLLLLSVVCTRICADLDAVHRSPCWDRITCHPHMITCRPCRPAVSCYTPSPHDYMPSVPPKPKFLLLVMLASWHPTFTRLFLPHAHEVVSAPNDKSVYTSTVTTSMPSSLF